MRYLFGAVLPLLLQVLLIVVLIESNTGNGSFVGLGAILLGPPACLVTLVVNLLLLRQSKPNQLLARVALCWLIALLAPIAITLLAMLG